MLAIVCMIRTGATYLPEFKARVDELSASVALRVIVGDNDSVDNTRELLDWWAGQGLYPVTVIDRSEGGPHYPSVDLVDRWRHIAHVMNGVLDLLEPTDDQVMYVDPDLVWDPAMVVRLLAELGGDRDVIAPVAWHPNGRPYDLWGTRRDGVPISGGEPFFEDVECKGLVEVDSAACLNVMDAHWARVARFGESNANVGWHDEMTAKGAHIWVDFDERVLHP